MSFANMNAAIEMWMRTNRTIDDSEYVDDFTYVPGKSDEVGKFFIVVKKEVNT